MERCRLAAPLTITGQRGFTLIEILLVAVIIGIVASLALPQLERVRERAMVARAIGDVDAIGWACLEYEMVHGEYPSSLSAVGWSGKEDPWGNPFQYARLTGVGKNGKTESGAKARKDHFLHPINTGFDLYSMGKDEATAAPLTAKASHDDIIWANDGGFVGLAAQY